MPTKPVMAITMGDPAGIGAEVAAKALAERYIYDKCRPVVIGSVATMQAAVKLAGYKAVVRGIPIVEGARGGYGTIDVMEVGGVSTAKIAIGQNSSEAGKASVEWVLLAGVLATAGKVAAIVTAPINKESCKMAGYKDIGHMEIFQRQSGAKEVATMLMADKLRVVHMTTHKSLRKACDYVTKDNVLSKIQLTNDHFKRWGFPAPRIGVAALNPHASDGGLIGSEEGEHIAPAVEAARAKGINAVGPVPADTVFNQAINGKYDVVLAMYHDQGHIAIKVHNWAKSVSVNLGLPFIRTSVDHGTAFDIAGKGVADHQSMLEAIMVAVDLASESRLR